MFEQDFFFLVGAQKAATSMLASLLRQHPDIYIPDVKEPNYIVSQFWNTPHQGPGDIRMESYMVDSPELFAALYGELVEGQLAGDASTSNLYYWKQTIPLIKEQFGDIPIIICLRNPVDRAYSAYMHLRRDMREKLSFEEGLAQEPLRREQNWSFIWFYRDVGYYFEQVRAYMENFSRVKVILFEDICEDAQKIVWDCFEFLSVEASFKPRLTAPVNASGEPINRILHSFLFKPGKLKGGGMKLASKLFPTCRVSAVVERLRAWNLKRIEMAPDTRRTLQEDYRESIDLLQKLIQRDLSEWKK